MKTLLQFINESNIVDIEILQNDVSTWFWQLYPEVTERNKKWLVDLSKGKNEDIVNQCISILGKWRKYDDITLRTKYYKEIKDRLIAAAETCLNHGTQKEDEKAWEGE